MATLTLPTSGYANPFEAGLNAMEREHYATAFRAWKDLAEDGEAEAQNNIGYLYERGYGVKQSYTRAIEWYKKAAAQKSPEAIYNLGMLAFEGYGMRQDYFSARRYFTEAAELDLADAHYMLGLIYYQGHGLKLNHTRAKTHFLDAAKLGNPKGQFMVALMLQNGEGHPAAKTEPLKSFIWGMVSKINGYPDANSVLEFSKMQLSQSVQDKAAELAQKCLDTGYANCPA
ncbi:MAG: tetratricopeptide repeat protein [Pseudomonadota bacterium]|nr:tetratricopeptide repeat protein [Pseudomonadota bacterium]